MQLIDVRGCRMQAGLAPVSVMQVRQHLDRGEQVLVFLNRRGFAPVLLCHACGWAASCPRCDAHMTIHRLRQRQVCHHCGHERALPEVCPDCGADDLIPVGHGTERIATDLAALFPDHHLVRIDRDSTRQRGSLEQALDAATSGIASLLVGTQMLAKGHHFPGVTLVVILDVDQGLFSADFRASERMAQLVLQVAGRAGRAELPGTVMLQTHHPGHPLLLRLIETGYPGFSEAALAERREAGFPPFAAQALLRAEATDRAAPDAFLAAAVALAGRNPDLDLWGPVPAPMERRAGRWRAQLLIRTRERALLHRFLDGWAPGLETLKEARRVRWSLDVDPMEMY
jgi:primosomal protein N' (replication factor Y)